MKADNLGRIARMESPAYTELDFENEARELERLGKLVTYSKEEKI
jgi:hypothetical protein